MKGYLMIGIAALAVMGCPLKVSAAPQPNSEKTRTAQQYYLVIKNPGRAREGLWTNAAVSIFPSKTACEEAKQTVQGICKDKDPGHPGRVLHERACSAACFPVKD